MLDFRYVGQMRPTPTLALVITTSTIALLGCEKSQAPASGAATSSAATASAVPALPATASASAPAPEAPKPTHPCPPDSVGDGTYKKPCEAKGKNRVMDVTWTGKTDDKGPTFRVVNNTKTDILFGNVIAYFYDKSGKQLEVSSATPGGKARPKQPCSGNIFAGPMKPGEKAVITFSCVKKEHIPADTKFIEAEMQMVGFPDATGSKADTYWRNSDLTPDARPKGGIK